MLVVGLLSLSTLTLRRASADAANAEAQSNARMAMMLAFGRQLLPSHKDQLTDHAWHYAQRRYDSRLLTGQTVVMLGFGAISQAPLSTLPVTSVPVTSSRSTSWRVLQSGAAVGCAVALPPFAAEAVCGFSMGGTVEGFAAEGLGAGWP